MITVMAINNNMVEQTEAMAMALLVCEAPVRDQVYTRSSHVGIG